MRLQPRPEERQAPDRLFRFARTVLHPDVKVLLCGLSGLGSNSASRVEMTTGKAHERAHRRVLGVEIDIAPEGQEFTKHEGVPNTSVNVYLTTAILASFTS